MSEHIEAVVVCLTAGLSDALARLIVASGTDLTTLENIRQAVKQHIANLDPPGVPLTDQTEIVQEALFLFNGIFAGAIVAAALSGATLTDADSLRPRAARHRRRGKATIAPEPPRGQASPHASAARPDPTARRPAVTTRPSHPESP